MTAYTLGWRPMCMPVLIHVTGAWLIVTHLLQQQQSVIPGKETVPWRLGATPGERASPSGANGKGRGLGPCPLHEKRYSTWMGGRHCPLPSKVVQGVRGRGLRPLPLFAWVDDSRGEGNALPLILLKGWIKKNCMNYCNIAWPKRWVRQRQNTVLACRAACEILQ